MVTTEVNLYKSGEEHFPINTVKKKEKKELPIFTNYKCRAGTSNESIYFLTHLLNIYAYKLITTTIKKPIYGYQDGHIARANQVFSKVYNTGK